VVGVKKYFSHGLVELHARARAHSVWREAIICIAGCLHKSLLLSLSLIMKWRKKQQEKKSSASFCVREGKKRGRRCVRVLTDDVS